MSTIDLRSLHLSNREARSLARTARVHSLSSRLSGFADQSFKAFTREHNSTHTAVTR